MPRDSHLHAGLAHIRKGGHDHLHVDSILVCWWRLSHGAGGVGDPGTPVKLWKNIRQREGRFELRALGVSVSVATPRGVQHLSVVSGGVLGCADEDGDWQQGGQLLSGAEFTGQTWTDMHHQVLHAQTIYHLWQHNNWMVPAAFVTAPLRHRQYAAPWQNKKDIFS